MKKSIKLILILFLLLTNVLTGCKPDEGPDDKPIALEPAGNVIDRYKKDNTDCPHNLLIIGAIYKGSRNNKQNERNEGYKTDKRFAYIRHNHAM